MRVDSLIGGRLCRQRSPGRVLTPAPPCRASLVTAGCGAQGKPEGSRPIRGLQARGRPDG